MAVVIKCDGCSATTKDESEFFKLGAIVERIYCEDCAKVMVEYERELRKRKEELREEHIKEINKVRYKYSQILELLPDVS
jgi:hypothetical protein